MSSSQLKDKKLIQINFILLKSQILKMKILRKLSLVKNHKKMNEETAQTLPALIVQIDSILLMILLGTHQRNLYSIKILRSQMSI